MKVIIEFDKAVPTAKGDHALFWLVVNIGSKEAYTTFRTRPTARQIRKFKKELRK